MIRLSRWLASAVVAAGLGIASMVPMPAHAQDTTARVLVDVADVVLRDGQPYYRHGAYRDADRLRVGRDGYGRPVYYRLVRVDHGRYYGGYPYVDRFDTRYDTARSVTCNKQGNCTVTYYDPRYDRRGYYTRYDGGYHDNGRHDGGRHDGRHNDHWRRDDRGGRRGHDDD